MQRLRHLDIIYTLALECNELFRSLQETNERAQQLAERLLQQDLSPELTRRLEMRRTLLATTVARADDAVRVLMRNLADADPMDQPNSTVGFAAWRNRREVRSLRRMLNGSRTSAERALTEFQQLAAR